jgi:hypothetical protein
MAVVGQALISLCVMKYEVTQALLSLTSEDAITLFVQ